MMGKAANDLPLFDYAEKQRAICKHRYSEVLDLLRSGHSIRESLKALGIHRSGFYRHMEQDGELRGLVNDLAPKRASGRLAIEPKLVGPDCPHVQNKIKHLLRYLERGRTFKDACKLASLSDTVVYKWKRENPTFADEINKAHQFNRSGKPKGYRDVACTHGRVDLGLQGCNHLYIIKAEGCDLVKVGTSMRPSKRLKGLQVGSPLKLTLHSYIVGAAHLEREVHESLTLKGLHSHGEWFHESCIPFVRSHIESHIGGLSNHLQQKVMSPIHAMTTTSA